MTGRSTAEARDVMDRVFFNALLIVQGVVLGYGAEVFVDVLRSGAPWASHQHASSYIAWVASILFAVLALVSQSFGSYLTPLWPTTSVIVLTIGLAISEFVGLGLLEPNGSEPAAIRPWLLAVAAQTAAAFLFVTLVLYYERPSHHPYTEMGKDLRRLVRHDQISAGLMSVGAGAVWLAAERYDTPDGGTLVVPCIIAAAAFVALVQQQSKLKVGIDLDDEAERGKAGAA